MNTQTLIPFRQQLEAAVEHRVVKPNWHDVILHEDSLETRLGTFFDHETAAQHRQSVIEAVMFAAERAAA